MSRKNTNLNSNLTVSSLGINSINYDSSSRYQWESLPACVHSKTVNHSHQSSLSYVRLLLMEARIFMYRVFADGFAGTSKNI